MFTPSDQPSAPGPRRGQPSADASSPLWQQPVSYAAIGATQRDDFLRYPPKGYRPVQRQVRIGHGVERWEYAWLETMTWGIKKRSGFRVEPVEAPAGIHDNSYSPVAFDETDEPVRAAELGPAEQVFGADGTPVLRAGDTAVLRLGPGALTVREPVRVVYVVDEPRRRGFGYGTLAGHPLRGEESFVVELRDDESVWLTIRSLSRPASARWWALAPALRIAQQVVLARYEHALTGRIPE